MTPKSEIAKENPNTEFLSIRLDDETEILVQPVSQSDGFGEVSSIAMNFDKVFSGIKKLSQQVKTILEEASPEETKIEFSAGFKVKNSELLAVIVNADMDASLKVTLTWKKI